MSHANLRVNIILGALVVSHLLVLVILFVSDAGPLFAGLLNMIAGIGAIFYWARKELRIQKHYYGWQEITALCFEALVIISAACFVAGNYWNGQLKTLQFTIFGIHLLCCLLMLIFMLTFKINKLI
jgi:hypothetical protein